MLLLLFLIMLGIICWGYFFQNNGWVIHNVSETFTQAGDFDLTMHILDVEQGECILVESDGEAMIIDAGSDDDADTILEYLEHAHVSELKYLILTHGHEDHIGSADDLLYDIPVDKVFYSGVEEETVYAGELSNAVEKTGVPEEIPVVGDVYLLGDASFEILLDGQSAYNISENVNDGSIGIMITNGDNNFLLYGDGECAAEQLLIDCGKDLSADVLKVAHHGSNTSTNEELLERVRPKYAVISCGVNNPYYYPHQAVLNELSEAGVSVYRTDIQGTIVIHSDGVNLDFNLDVSKEFETDAGEVQ